MNKLMTKQREIYKSFDSNFIVTFSFSFCRVARVLIFEWDQPRNRVKYRCPMTFFVDLTPQNTIFAS